MVIWAERININESNSLKTVIPSHTPFWFWRESSPALSNFNQSSTDWIKQHAHVKHFYIFIYSSFVTRSKMAEGGVTVKQEPVEAVELESRFVLCTDFYDSPMFKTGTHIWHLFYEIIIHEQFYPHVGKILVYWSYPMAQCIWMDWIKRISMDLNTSA